MSAVELVAYFLFGLEVLFVITCIISVVVMTFDDWRWRRRGEAADAFRAAQRETDARRYVDDGALR